MLYGCGPNFEPDPEQAKPALVPTTSKTPFQAGPLTFEVILWPKLNC